MQQYTVKPKDTLFLIAKEFDVPLAQLINANPQITNPNAIDVGQIITIPDVPEVPEQIGIIETDAINIIDDIFMADWQSADRRMNEIRTALDEVVPVMQQAQVPNHVVTGLNTTARTLEQHIAGRRPFPAMSQANRITQLLADALDFFEVIAPTDLIRLGFFARQIIVNVEQKDWPEAYQNYRRALSVWDRLSPELERAYPGDVTATGQAFDQMNTAINRRDYLTAINSANRILELLGVLTTDFEQLYT